MIYINLLIIFLLIITIHEFGHYFSARLFNAKVTDFSIGFGKPLFQFIDKNKTRWIVAIIPLGGYVKIKGLDTIFQKEKKDEYESGTFQSLSLIKKIVILLSGSFFNIISAWICLFCFMFFIGISEYSPKVGKVMNNSSASKNDIREGDIIMSINSKDINNFLEIPKAIGGNEFIKIKISRKNKIIDKSFYLDFNEDTQRHIIGIMSTEEITVQKYNFSDSIINSILFIPNYYKSSILFLKNSIKKNTIANELSGPIGLVKNADKLMLDQIKGILFLFILISLFVGMFNLFPIPLLDGGHIVYFIVRSIFSDSLPIFITKIYLTIGISIISILFILITFNDIFYK
jgi:regulator of sigma E protease|tara:strand:- start:212 stop:1246 length:1035 start_codon:yes stop_codon:yes gene_type:complete